jgi:maleylacetoacetate isomerase
MAGIVLYNYFRSSTSYRVRIALNLKKLAYDYRPVHLRRGEQSQAAYRALNPQGVVPTLVVDGLVLTQSMAILDYLEERWPDPALLPADLPGRARVQALAQLVAADMHPLNNLRVLRYLEGELALAHDARQAWIHRWLREGFDALEALLSPEAGTGRFCHGRAPTLADLCLVPQVFNAERFGFDLAPYPRLRAIVAACRALPAFAAADPARQPDAE